MIMLFIYLIAVFLSWISSTGSNFTCYSCYYSIEHLNDSWNHPECMNRPWTLNGVGTKVPCLEKNFCNIQATYDTRTGQVKEFSRKCYVVGLKTECVKDTYNMICTRSCKGDFCNRNDTADSVINTHNKASGIVGLSTILKCVYLTFIVCSLNILVHYLE